MKKYLFVCIAALGLSMFVESCNTKKEKDAQELAWQRERDSLMNELRMARNESGDLVETVNQIEEGFRQINEAENIVISNQRDGGNRQAIIDNMALIQDKLKLNRELIANLQQQLRTSNSGNAEMKKKLEETIARFNQQLEEKTKQIESLRQELEKRDIRIAEQDEQITHLNENVGQLTENNQKQQRTIEQNTEQIARQDQELHTAYFVFGTKKELRQQRILQNGDVLKSSDFNRDYFTKIDYRVTKTIKLYSKSATLLTSHPADSYALDRDAQGQYTLRITNPDRFWSTSKYLVISVK
ncbi:MAG: hypothetical protein IJ692_03795 [Alloprevotella sp.]|nr:hypothetical protein [Alloprevotella sp.]MBR1652496.1 hypothetical protein [Alloprevotella sp.]